MTNIKPQPYDKLLRKALELQATMLLEAYDLVMGT